MNQTPKSIADQFQLIEDPRRDTKNKRHLLGDILTIALCATLSGADDWVSIAQFGRAKEAWFTSFLELPNNIPSHDTFGRVFALLNPHHFIQVFCDWIRSTYPNLSSDVIAIDGKTIRRSHNQENGKAANKQDTHPNPDLGVSRSSLQFPQAINTALFRIVNRKTSAVSIIHTLG